MKKTMLMATLIFSIGATAQTTNNKGVVLQKGQAITTLTNADSEIDMSMGGMKNSTSNKVTYTVIGEDDTNYAIISKIISMKMSMDGMGQSMTFDSEKTEDMNGEMGTQLAGKLGKTDTFLLSKKDGKLTMISQPDEDNDNPMMMGAGIQNAQSNLFIIIPSLTAGTSWSDSLSIKNTKIKSVYTLQSVENGIATVKLLSNMDGTNEFETQGMTMTMRMNMKTDGTLKIDTKTGMVMSNNANTDMTGNMDVMGQEIPINSKIVSSSIVQ